MGAYFGWAVVPTVCLLAACQQSSLTADKDDAFYPIHEDSAGVYLTVGPREGEQCNWARTSRPSRDVADFIEVGEGKPGENTRVSLRPGDYFISWGCRPWRRQ